VFAAEHFLDLRRFDLGLERFDRAMQVARDILAGLRPLEQDAKVVELPGKRIAEGDLVAQATASLQQLLCFGLVGPEVGRGDALLEVGELVCRIACVKDSSAGLWRV
jgi:hypothetical protein